MILNYNGAFWLAPLFESLRQDAVCSTRIYLVDNCSNDDSVSLVRRSFPEVTILRMPQNLGYSMAYNMAMPQAFADGCDWVILANNDIKLEANCVAELIRVALQMGRGGILGPAFLAWDGDEANYYMKGVHPEAVAALHQRQDAPRPVDWVEGSFLMVSQSCTLDVGPLDPLFFFYWEEVDFCRRARFRGWSVLLVTTAVARHYAGGSTKLRGDDSFERLKTRNYYIFTLTDPNCGWFHNLMSALHLLLVRLKAGCLRAELPIVTELKVFGSLMWEWRMIRRKWLRDRSGEQPPALHGVNLPINVEVTLGSRWKS